MALDGDDLHLKAALLELADDFDLEAATIEGQLGNRCLRAASTLAPSPSPWRLADHL
jgi:hypothetical protein